MKTEFLKERYDFELQRKEQLTSALTLPVGVLSGLGGLMTAMVRAFSEDVEVREVVIEPEESFDIHLRERMIEAADRNTANNELRSGLLHRGRVALFRGAHLHDRRGRDLRSQSVGEVNNGETRSSAAGDETGRRRTRRLSRRHSRPTAKFEKATCRSGRRNKTMPESFVRKSQGSGATAGAFLFCRQIAH